MVKAGYSGYSGHINHIKSNHVISSNIRSYQVINHDSQSWLRPEVGLGLEFLIRIQLVILILRLWLVIYK